MPYLHFVSSTLRGGFDLPKHCLQADEAQAAERQTGLEKVMLTIGDLGPFEGNLNVTPRPNIYELHFERVQNDQAIFREARRIQIVRDGDCDLFGKAQRIQFELAHGQKYLTAGKIEFLAG